MSTTEITADSIGHQPRIGSGAIFWLIMLAAPLPVVFVYLYRMWQMPHYGYFPFLLAAVAYLAVTRGVGAWRLPTRWTIGAAVLVGQSVAMLGAAVNSPWLAVIGWIMVIMAALANRPGSQTRHLLYLSLPLILLVRLPLGWDHMLVITLQNWTTALTSVMLDLMGVPHLVKNNTVTLVSGDLLVAEACSGIQSVFTLAFIATMFVVWNRRPWWTMPVYLAAAVALAVAGNVMRVTTIAIFQHNGWIDLSEGWAHAGLGYLVLGIAGALLLSFDCLIAAVFPSLDAVADHVDNPFVSFYCWLSRTSEPVVDRSAAIMFGAWPRWMRHVVLGSFSMAVCLIIGTSTWAAARLVAKDWRGPVGIFAEGLIVDASGLGDQPIGPAVQLIDHRSTRQNNDPILGQNADVWSVAWTHSSGSNNVIAQAVISQTYQGWHELCVCYQNQGFELAYRNQLDPSAPVPLAYAKFFRDDQMGDLFYGAVDASGNIVAPPARMGQLEGRLAQLIDPTPNNTPMAMIQVWHSGPVELSQEAVDAMRRAASTLLRRSSEAIRDVTTPGGQNS